MEKTRAKFKEKQNISSQLENLLFVIVFRIKRQIQVEADAVFVVFLVLTMRSSHTNFVTCIATFTQAYMPIG